MKDEMDISRKICELEGSLLEVGTPVIRDGEHCSIGVRKNSGTQASFLRNSNYLTKLLQLVIAQKNCNKQCRIYT